MLSASVNNTLLDLHNSPDDIVSASSNNCYKVLLLLISPDEGIMIIVLFLYVYAKVNCLLSLTPLHVLMLLFHECTSDVEQWMANYWTVPHMPPPG